MDHDSPQIFISPAQFAAISDALDVRDFSMYKLIHPETPNQRKLRELIQARFGADAEVIRNEG